MFCYPYLGEVAQFGRASDECEGRSCACACPVAVAMPMDSVAVLQSQYKV